MYWFTSDEHYGHQNILKYQDRPFDSLTDMDCTIIDNHNSLVEDEDTTIHAGDFSFRPSSVTSGIIRRLKGRHIFVRGSHDYWTQAPMDHLWMGYFDLEEYSLCKKWSTGLQTIVVCHYPMLRWPSSHYGSWQLFGHVHGRLGQMPAKQYDVGVESNNYRPVSLKSIVEIMKALPDNPNLVLPRTYIV